MSDQPQTEALPRRDPPHDGAPPKDAGSPSSFDVPQLLSQFDSVVGNRSAFSNDKNSMPLANGSQLELNNPFATLDTFAPLRTPILTIASDQSKTLAEQIQTTSGLGTSDKSPSSEDGSDKQPKVGEGSPERQRLGAPLVSPERFSTVAKEVLSRIDTQNTGKVDKQQLAQALEDPSFTGEHAQALAALYANFDKLQNLSGQQGFFDKRAISSADLDTYEQRRAQQVQARDQSALLATWGNTNLAKFDRTGQGVTAADIDAALAAPTTSQTDFEMLSLLKAQLPNIQAGRDEYAPAGITAKDLADYQLRQNNNPMSNLENSINGMAWRVNQGQKPDINRDLYGDKQNPLNSITPEAITQGHIGNCYLVSTIASVAQSNPQAIRDMIKDNGNGTYTVTFPGAKNTPITIKAPTEAEQGMFNGASRHGIWASVLEKAAGELYNQGTFRSIFGRTYSPTEGGDGGGHLGPVMRLLTGNNSESFSTTFNSQRSIGDQLSAALSDKPPRAITAGTNYSPFSDVTADGFARLHAYSITGFTPDGKGGGTVTIRNPWNSGQGPGGTTQISLEAFMRNFGDITVERRR